MGFNFFKALYRNLTNIGKNIGLNIIVLILYASRKTRTYISYMKYKIRIYKQNEACLCVDKRFYEKESSNQQVVFPFYNFCEIKCNTIVGNQIKLSDIQFENVKNIGIIFDSKTNKKPKISIKDIISFCNLPITIDNMNFNSYPWDNVKAIELNSQEDLIIE
uniref:Uncharacterized protein n=1 Tax=viral metagenome TaxID=1070528 RepID=A0A6C0KYQ0_9ZZZZ|tara:strand:+ start:10826 stop:11311 length:486 start_codon:yes stop_codon:yes gene_type:complete